MLNAVIFDMDGTLGDTLPLCIESFRRAIYDMDGRSLADEEISRHFGPSDLGVIQRLLPDNPELVKPAMERMLYYYKLLHPSMSPAPFPGTIELLQKLQDQGIILGMVTGKCMETAIITLKQFRIFEFFPMVEPGSPGKVIKGECLLRIADHYGLAPDEMLYVGDAVSDIVACRQSSVPIAAAAWASTAEPEKLKAHEPNYLFTDFFEFSRFILSAVIEDDQER